MAYDWGVWCVVCDTFRLGRNTEWKIVEDSNQSYLRISCIYSDRIFYCKEKEMKNALILHGTDFKKTQTQRVNNWFPWLKQELEQREYNVWLPELPHAWEPDLTRYWNFLKNFDFNKETLLIGHSSGAAMVFGLLHKLPREKTVKKAISVAGFYKDEGWNCAGLFSEIYDWEKIKHQAKNISLVWSPDDPYISKEQTQYLARVLDIKPIIFQNKGHFNLEKGEKFRQFPELLEMILE